MRYYTSFILFSVFLIVCTNNLNAQVNDFKRYQDQQIQDFQNFLSEQDRLFSDFLRKEWIEVSITVTEIAEIEKPEIAPAVISEISKDQGSTQNSTGLEAQLDLHMGDSKSLVSLLEEESLVNLPERIKLSDMLYVQVELFGGTYDVIYSEVFRTTEIQNLNNDKIADYWLELANSSYQLIINDILELSKLHLWSDWVTAIFVRHYADTLIADENSQVALTWFVLNKMGYGAKVGYSGNRLVIILPSATPVYAVPKYNLEGYITPFYMMDNVNRNISGIRRILTYASDEKLSGTAVNLHMNDYPIMKPKIENRFVSFTSTHKAEEAILQYDRNMVQLLKTYPQTDLEIFFNAPVSVSLESSLREALVPLIEGLTQGEQLNILLRFVQTAFEYKTDTNQFGRQRFMTPDEIMYYPYSDCDDRAILFAYLVRTLLDLEVIGLMYSTHVATAVLADQSLDGDHILYNGKKYLVCDPTYIMADYGMTMPKFKNEKPTVISIK